MTLKHKLKKSTSATSLALTDALNKLQELELQATENRFKVNQVHESVEKTLREYGKYRVMGLDDGELDLAKASLRGRVENMFDSFDDNHIKEQHTLETIKEGLQNSIKDDQQAGANGSAKQKKKKSDDANKEEEKLGDPDEAEDFISMEQAYRQKHRTSIVESQNHLAKAKQEEEARREVAQLMIKLITPNLRYVVYGQKVRKTTRIKRFKTRNYFRTTK